jgi:LysM repeat protein
MENQSTENKETLTTLSSYVIALEEKVNALSLKIEKMADVPKKTVTQKTADQPSQKHHTIVKGDTLYSIAKKYGLSVEEIRRLNNLSPTQPIKAGQKLIIATGGN